LPSYCDAIFISLNATCFIIGFESGMVGFYKAIRGVIEKSFFFLVVTHPLTINAEHANERPFANIDMDALMMVLWLSGQR